jgi:hypothetical protein
MASPAESLLYVIEFQLRKSSALAGQSVQQGLIEPSSVLPQRKANVISYLPSGHLVFLRQNLLLAAPFDLRTLSVKAVPQPVPEDMGGRFEAWNYDFSQNGSLVYLSQPRDEPNSIFWLDRSGKLSLLQAEH